MITYKQIFAVLRQGAYINSQPNTELHRKLLVLYRTGIVGFRVISGEFVLMPEQVRRIEAKAKQIKPSAPVLVVGIPAKTSHSSDLGRVRAMLTQRGLSCGSYAVLAESESRYQIEISTDPTRSMKHWIAKTRCEKVAQVEMKAA